MNGDTYSLCLSGAGRLASEQDDLEDLVVTGEKPGASRWRPRRTWSGSRRRARVRVSCRPGGFFSPSSSGRVSLMRARTPRQGMAACSGHLHTASERASRTSGDVCPYHHIIRPRRSSPGPFHLADYDFARKADSARISALTTASCIHLSVSRPAAVWRLRCRRRYRPRPSSRGPDGP